MLEILLGGPEEKSETPNADGWFFFDGITPPTITIDRTGAVYETVPTIDGKTLVFATVNDQAVVNFSPALNLAITDWTFEWSTLNTVVPTAAYCNEFLWYPVTTANSAIGLRGQYGDGGFGNRLQFGGSMGDLPLVFNSPENKTTMNGVLKRFALVSKNKNISLFINGNAQPFATGTGTTYNVPSFVTDRDISAITRILLGNWFGGGGGAIPSKRGPMRFTMRALYSGNYTPEPIG